ncbi:MAG: ATP synthase F1 subunit epsilon [Ignavibacteria bacterium]|nr:ATP synthase F1 subunit epsilon [Ignavibacteria bacterium]
MEKLLYLEIIGPAKVFFKGNVTSVTIPGKLGEFQVLYNHASLVSTLGFGRIKIEKESGDKELFYAKGGVVEVKKNKVVILAEEIIGVNEIDREEVENELSILEKKLLEKGVNKVEILDKMEILRTKLRLSKEIT